MQTGYSNNGKNIGTVIVCFVGFVPTVAKKYIDIIITVAAESNETLIVHGRQRLVSEFQSLLIGFVLKNNSLVTREISRAVTVPKAYCGEDIPSCQFLRAAGVVYSLFLEANGREDWLEWQSRYEDQLERLEDQIVNLHTRIDLISALRRILHKAVNAGMHVVHRDELFDDDMQQIDKIIIFDECFYYISDAGFSEICENFGVNLSVHQIKVELSENGTIKGTGGDDGKRGYYTVKLPLYGVNGNRMTPRMIRLCRDKIDIAGEEELWQIAESEKGVGNFGDLRGRYIEGKA